MAISKTKLKDIERTPWLNECMNTYFAPGQFVFDKSHLEDIKWRRDGYYVIMLFRVGDEYHSADVAGALGGHFDVCNDSIDMDLETWMGVKVDPYCDGFTTKEDRK